MKRGHARHAAAKKLAEHDPKHLDSIESLRGVAVLMVLLYPLAEQVKTPLPGSLGFIPTHFGLGVPCSIPSAVLCMTKALFFDQCKLITEKQDADGVGAVDCI